MDFDGCDVVASKAAASDMAFRGHNLCWGNQNPDWLENGALSADEKKAALVSHIDAMLAQCVRPPSLAQCTRVS